MECCDLKLHSVLVVTLIAHRAASSIQLNSKGVDRGAGGRPGGNREKKNFGGPSPGKILFRRA